MFSLRLGTSVYFCKEDYYERLAEMERLGFDAGDFDITSKWFEPDEEEEYYKNLEKGLDAFQKTGMFLNGVHISFGNDWDISAINEEKRKEVVERIKAVFTRTNPYHPYCYILHGSFEPIKAEERTLHIEALKKSLKELRPFTDAKICVEILPRTCLFNTSKEALEIVESLDGIDVCVDVNHFLQEKSEEGLLRLGSYVKTLHISDHDYVDERHWLPGNGSIDWMKLIGSLEKIGYTGMFHYESAGTHEEVKQNYLGLFARYNEK